MQQSQLIYENMQPYSDYCDLNTYEDGKTHEYFSGVTFMYNQLNHVEAMYYKLLELSKLDNPESKEAASILFRIEFAYSCINIPVIPVRTIPVIPIRAIPL